MPILFVTVPIVQKQNETLNVNPRRDVRALTETARMGDAPKQSPQPPISRRAVLQAACLTLISTPLQTRSAPSEEVKQEAAQEEKPISDIDPITDEPEITDRVYIDLSIPGQPSRRLIIGLYGNLTPRTVDNFKRLAENGYADTSVYRIVPGLTIQMGDVLGNGGKSGRPAIDDGRPFLPDNYRVKHTMPGIVSMVRRPDGLVDSRFFVATRPGDSMYLDGRYVGFGRVLQGLEFVREVEKAGGEGFVRRPVRISASGVLQ